MNENKTTYLGPFYILGNNHEILPCPDRDVFGKWFVDIKNRRVAVTLFETPSGHVCVSTVFLAIDRHGTTFDEKPPRGLFETCVFGGVYIKDVRADSDTWEQAEQRHKMACELVLKKGDARELP